MKLGLVGVGLIGGSIAFDLRKYGQVKHIYGYDENPKHLQNAFDFGMIDSISTLEQLAKECDYIIVSIPVGASIGVIRTLLSSCPTSTTIFDVGSTKEVIAHHFESHPRRHQLVLTHPMAGTEFSGPAAAHSGMFDGKAVVICDQERSGVDHLEKIISIYGLLGMRVIFMSSHSHDLHVAFVSHLSHISSFVLAETVLEKEKDERKIFDLASGGLESTVRLAKSSPSMWTSIFEQNRENILMALSDYIMQLQKFQNQLQNKKYEEIFKMMNEANEIKRVLSQITRTRAEKNEKK